MPVKVAAGIRSPAEFFSPLELSPDEKWALFEYSAPASHTGEGGSSDFLRTGSPLLSIQGARNQVRLINLPNGKFVELAPDGASAWGASWSPDGSQIAYYSDYDGEAGLWVVNTVSHRSRRIGDRITRGYFGTERPIWIDKSTVLAKVLPPGMSVEQANALINSWVPERRVDIALRSGNGAAIILEANQIDGKVSEDVALPSGETRLRGTGQSYRFGDLAIIDIKSGKARYLTNHASVTGYKLSPDRRFLAVTTLSGESDHIRDLYELAIYDLKRGALRSTFRKLRFYTGAEFNWSPDSTRLAATVLNDEAVREIRLLSLDGGTKWFGEDVFDLPERSINAKKNSPRSLTFDAPLWSAVRSDFYAIMGGAVWRFDPDGLTAAPAIADSDVRATRIASRAGSNIAWEDNAGELLVFATDTTTLHGQLLRLNPETGKTTLHFDAGAREIGSSNADVSGQGDVVAMMRDADHINDIWLVNAEGRARQLTDMNPDLHRYDVGTKKIVTWRNGNGREVKGLLILPPGKENPKTPLPTIVEVYGGFDQAEDLLNRYGGYGGESPQHNNYLYSTRGYAVFVPGLPIGEEDEPADSIADSLHTGVDALVGQGIADPERLALRGHSYGSYTIMVALTRSERFKAAIMTAVIHPSLFVSYTSTTSGSMDNGLNWTEYGQGRMQGDPWSRRDRYFRNSPFFEFDKITTPILMGKGEYDRLASSDTVFVSLMRLGKAPVRYLVYPDEGHSFKYYDTFVDFWSRQLEFLEKYIGKPEGE